MIKKLSILLLVTLVFFSGKPVQESQPIKELDISYFMANFGKPKNEVWVCYFWATWCLNCVKSHNILSQLDSEFKNRHVRLLSLSLDSKKSDWTKFIGEHPASWEQIYAADTRFDKKFRKTFGSIDNLPQLFIIKRDGKAYRIKYLNQLKAELQKLVEEE